jgi:tetratricopeptide (TPR) repeat protein
MTSAAATTPDTPRPSGVLVFISYAHVDEALRVELRTHLSALEREGLVQAWDDREILAGDAWADVIDARLDQADVILLLVSADFIRSEYCYGKELARALERHADRDDRAIVIPIILRNCDWESTRFAHLQALPDGGRAMSEWKSADDYHTAVAKGLRRRLQRLIDPDTNPVERVWGRLRDPLWWQQPRVWAGALAVAALGLGATVWWWKQAASADAHVVAALAHLRSGRFQSAVAEVAPACSAWVRREACFVLDKASLVLKLEEPQAPPLEEFAAKIKALQTRAPDDPDLLFLSAQLAWRENRPERHDAARADIVRAIALSGERFPEAYFYLANLEMLQERHAEALPLLDRALDPRVNAVAPAHYLNARAHARAHSGDVQGALHDYEQSAELGIIVSRIGLAELLWWLSDFERASDQLLAARRELGDAPKPLEGRNTLPWAFEIDGGRVVLRQPAEKRCFADWMHRAGLALAGRADAEPPPAWADCGPEATRIALALTASLRRAIGAGMNDTGRERVLEFARRYGL